MTRDELIEKVWATFNNLSRDHNEAMGDVIDIVLEEAAKVCEGWRPTGGSQEYRKGYAAAADESAEAIRALKGE